MFMTHSSGRAPLLHYKVVHFTKALYKTSVVMIIYLSYCNKQWNLSGLIQWRAIPCPHKIQSRSMGDLLCGELRDLSSCHLLMPPSQHVPSRCWGRESERQGITLPFNCLPPEITNHTFVHWLELVPWLHPNYKRDQWKYGSPRNI